MLKFSEANAKTQRLYAIGIVPTGKKVYSLDLPSGWACPGARECLSKCVDGKIQDGKHTRFRCFSASQEVVFPKVHEVRQHNLAILKQTRGAKQVADIIETSLPADAGVIRYHVGGDFFKPSYFQGALLVARRRPDIRFYTYTKSIPTIIPYLVLPSRGIICDNFFITASRGGKYDQMISDYCIREAVVVFSKAEAQKLGLEIDHDDSHASCPGPSFALLLHGVQPARSEASAALSRLRRDQ